MSKRIRISLIVFLLIISATCLTVVGQGYELYREAINEIGVVEMIDEISKQTDYIDISEVSPEFLKAIISVEDHRFYEHQGVDMIAISRAIVNDLKAGAYVEGGSTISQQLAKNMYFSNEKRIQRKIAELFVASQLERRYSKDKILEVYINVIYFGDGYTGIMQATKGYFHIEPSELSLTQAVLLAGLPQAPSKYALSTNFEGAIKRSQHVMRTMIKNNYLTIYEANMIYRQNACMLQALS